MRRFLTHHISVFFFLCFLPWSMNGQSYESVANKCSFDIEVAISEPNCQGQADGQVQLRLNTVDVKARWLDGPRAGQALDQTIVPNLSAGIYRCEFSKSGSCKDTIPFEIVDPPQLRAEPNNILVCDDGAAVKLMKSITGGRPPYKFDFAATDNNSVASCLNCDADFVLVDRTTNFIVTIKDSKGCLRQREVKIEVAPKIELMVEVEDANCFGEENASITLSPNILSNVVNYTLVGAGDEPAVVQDTPEFDNLTNGQYTIIAEDENGCTEFASVDVNVAENPEPIIAGSSTFCIGSSATMDAGSGFTTYLWSDGSNNQTLETTVPGDFEVTVTNENGCEGIATFSVTQSSELTPEISGDFSFCQGESTVLDAGAGFENYIWSDGTDGQSITTQEPGTYSVTVSDATGCTGTTDVFVTVNQLPVIDILVMNLFVKALL